MKPIPILLAAAFALPAAANQMPLSFEARVAQARVLEEDERFHPYPSQVMNAAKHRFAPAMRNCWHLSAGQKARSFVLVADIGDDGWARAVEVRPAHAAARCFASRFAAIRYLPPPPFPGREGFPVTMRVAGGR